jgi:hypothetical protein
MSAEVEALNNNLTLLFSPTMLQHLPVELIEHIFSSIDPSDKTTLAAVCATGTLGRKVTTPLLYQLIELCEERGHHPEAVQAQEKFITKLHLLCRTLLENSQLAGIVQRIKYRIGVETAIYYDRIPPKQLKKRAMRRRLQNEMGGPRKRHLQ